MDARACIAFGFLTGAISPFVAQSDEPATATCGTQRAGEQCRIAWTFTRPSGAYYWVQQLDPQTRKWQSLGPKPDGTSAQGSRAQAVEAGYLYRVLACDDAEAKLNCAGSSMIWAALIPPPDQVDLIPPRVVTIGPGGKRGAAMVAKNADWLTQVVQYNVYLMGNALGEGNIADLPDMTPATDIQAVEANDPVDQVQFNVYAAYAAAQGRPIETPISVPSVRKPHEHPERH